jgi:hypothetical protein
LPPTLSALPHPEQSPSRRSPAVRSTLPHCILLCRRRQGPSHRRSLPVRSALLCGRRQSLSRCRSPPGHSTPPRSTLSHRRRRSPSRRWHGANHRALRPPRCVPTSRRLRQGQGRRSLLPACSVPPRSTLSSRRQQSTRHLRSPRARSVRRRSSQSRQQRQRVSHRGSRLTCCIPRSRRLQQSQGRRRSLLACSTP